MYWIEDWAGNWMFDGMTFRSFDKAEDYLSIHLGDSYEEDRQEYYIEYEENDGSDQYTAWKERSQGL